MFICYWGANERTGGCCASPLVSTVFFTFYKRAQPAEHPPFHPIPLWLRGHQQLNDETDEGKEETLKKQNNDDPSAGLINRRVQRAHKSTSGAGGGGGGGGYKLSIVVGCYCVPRRLLLDCGWLLSATRAVQNCSSGKNQCNYRVEVGEVGCYCVHVVNYLSPFSLLVKTNKQTNSPTHIEGRRRIDGRGFYEQQPNNANSLSPSLPLLPTKQRSNRPTD